MRRARDRSDRGETLIELVVAIGIMSTAVVAVIGCLVTGIMVSDIHRKQTTAGVTLRNYAEAIDRTVDAGGYPTGCAALTASFTAPAGFSASIAGVGYWTGSGWSSTCSTDSGVRQLTLQVVSSDSPGARQVVEQLVIVVRKPCRLGESLCG